MNDTHPSLTLLNESVAQENLRREITSLAEKTILEITERKNGLLAEIAALTEKKRILQEQTDAVQIKLDDILSRLERMSGNVELEHNLLVKMNTLADAELTR